MARQYKHLMINSIIALTLTGCAGNGCSSRKEVPPEVQLNKYIEKAVNITKASEREDLLRFTSGNLKEKLGSMSDVTFKEAYIDKRYDFKTFEVLETRHLSEKELQIDFRVVYKSWRTGEWQERAPLIDTNNRVYMVFEYGQWAIDKVENLGSSFEWEVGMPVNTTSTSDLEVDK